MALTAVALLVADVPAAAAQRSRRRRHHVIETLVGFAAFLILAFLRVPMAFAMGIVGFVGVGYMLNFNVAASMIAQITYETGMSYTLSVIPLFILMGNFVVRAKLSDELYHAAYCFLGHLRGGLAMSTVIACAGFGAICGSSIATAATFTKVSYPSMRKYGYTDELAAGSIAAGGTLGILIPPSVIMVIYGIMTETSIGKLFIAGIIPGLIATVLLCLAVVWITRRDPDGRPAGRAALLGRAHGRAQIRLAGDRAVRAGDRRHLRRRLHRDRRRRHRRRRRVPVRAGAPRADLARAVRGAGGKRAHHLDAVHDPDRRAAVRQLRQLHDHAGRPEAVRLAVQGDAGAGGRSRSARSTSSSAPRWRSCR